jgi:hypothetical protein
MSHYHKFVLLLSKINPEKLLLAVALVQLLTGDDSPPSGR